MHEVSPLLLGGLIGACALCAFVALGAAAYASRGFPIGLRRLARELAERVDAAEADWTRTRGQLAIQLEELSELNESIERKRARIAASASKLGRTTEGAGAENDIDKQRELVKQRARQQGYQV